jgi:hypothetical protein
MVHLDAGAALEPRAPAGAAETIAAIASAAGGAARGIVRISGART